MREKSKTSQQLCSLLKEDYGLKREKKDQEEGCKKLLQDYLFQQFLVVY